MHLTGPGLTGVTVFTQRLLSQGCESHSALITARLLSVIHSPLVVIKSGHSSHVFLLTSQTGIFSSPPSEPRPQQLPASSSILMQSLWPHKLCSGYFFPEQSSIRTLPLINTAELWVSTVNSSFKRFSLMASPLKVSVWDYMPLSLILCFSMNHTASQKVTIFQRSFVVVFTLGHQILRTVPISPLGILMAPVIGSKCWGNVWFMSFVHAECYHGIYTKCTCWKQL